MAGLILVLGCMILGVILRKIPNFPVDAHKGLNAFLIYVALPAITLRYLPALELHWSLLFPAAMAWIVFMMALLLFPLLGAWRGWSRQSVGCLVLVAGLGNTSFVGFPLVEAFYGEEGLQIAILCDQPGSFLVLSTLGLLSMSYFLTGSWNVSSIGGELLRFPPFLAFLVAVLCLCAGLTMGPWLQVPLEALSATLTPVAMVSIGLQLRNPWKAGAQWEVLSWGLLLKLIVSPLVILLLYHIVFQIEPLTAKVSVLEAAMGPMVTPSIIAMERNMNPPLAALLIAIGIPISLMTVFGWYWLLEIWV